MKSAPRSEAAKKAAKTKSTGAGSDANPTKYWDDYFKKHGDKPDELWDLVYLLRSEKKYDHLEAALRSYLINQTKSAEPWMYQMLAVTVELRKGSPAEIKTLLGYAAYQAKLSRNPNHLVSVADLLLLRGILDRVGPAGNQTDVGELLDLAAEIVPHRPQPPLMSLQLASRLKDPKRFEANYDRLLSLGWPGADEQIRADARRQAEALAETLRGEDRGGEASALIAKLAESESRDLFIRLTWTGEADIDLIIDEPLGATANFQNPRTVFGGALVKNGYGNHPEEVYVCPRGFSGKYTIRFETIFTDPAKPVTKATLEVITHEGLPGETRIAKSIDLTKAEPVTVELTGGRRKTVLPLSIAPPLLPASPRPTAPKAETSPQPAAKPAAPKIQIEP
ncbi:MAG: hypothetical protein SFX72_15305 [Isosphaeraceae bacterium]|nr:hypothetical protein [Isosphaeraceae bacterium]